jgi:hypothetical protein
VWIKIASQASWRCVHLPGRTMGPWDHHGMGSEPLQNGATFGVYHGVPWGIMASPWFTHVKYNTHTCHLRGLPGLSHVWGLELRIQWKMNVATLNHQNWGISNLSDKLMWTFCKEKSTHLQTYHCDRCASHNLTHILTNVWSIFGKMS